LEHGGIVWIRRKKEKEKKESARDNEINDYGGIVLQVSSCTYDLLAIFSVHGICMQLFGYDLSCRGGLFGLIVVFPSLVISWITMELWVSHLIFVQLVLMLLMAMGSVTSSWSLGWENALEALEQLGLSY